MFTRGSCEDRTGASVKDDRAEGDVERRTFALHACINEGSATVHELSRTGCWQGKISGGLINLTAE